MVELLRSPIRWFGGKGMMVKKLLALVPPHRYYVEVFGGGASLLFAKQPALVETYNDLNEGLVNYFRVLREPEKTKELQHRLELTPYSRAEYEYCRKTWDKQDDVLERAYRWFVVARMSFSGLLGQSISTTITLSRRGKAASVSRWQSTIKMLPALHKRMLNVQIECQDWRTILDRYNELGYLAYLDPPYVQETRSGGGYKYEITVEDHEDLVKRILDYPAMIMLSGYDHEVYAPLVEAGWDLQKFETVCFATGRTRATGILGKGSAKKAQARVECVWRNPAAIKAFDYLLFNPLV